MVTPSTCKSHHQNLLETLLCVWWFSSLCFLAIFVVGFSSIFHNASSQANPSVDDAKPSASDPKKKSSFPYFDGFWWRLQRVEVSWFYGYMGSMMGFWFWFAGSFVWLEWMIVHSKSYFYICAKHFFFFRKNICEKLM